MISKVFKCKTCDTLEEVDIQTYDIIERYGKVDIDKLTERIEESSICPTCGRKRNQIYSPIPTYWFEMGIGKGKISQRFK